MTTVFPEAAMTPPAPIDQRTADLFGRVTDSIIKHGATPGQAVVLADISRAFDRPGTPATLRLAARVLAHTAAERVTA